MHGISVLFLSRYDLLIEKEVHCHGEQCTNLPGYFRDNLRNRLSPAPGSSYQRVAVRFRAGGYTHCSIVGGFPCHCRALRLGTMAGLKFPYYVERDPCFRSVSG